MWKPSQSASLRSTADWEGFHTSALRVLRRFVTLASRLWWFPAAYTLSSTRVADCLYKTTSEIMWLCNTKLFNTAYMRRRSKALWPTVKSRVKYVACSGISGRHGGRVTHHSYLLIRLLLLQRAVRISISFKALTLLNRAVQKMLLLFVNILSGSLMYDRVLGPH